MNDIKLYVENKLFQSKNEDTRKLLFETIPYKRRTINIFILIMFVILIAFYSTLSLLLMSLTLLLFIYWLVQVEFLSVKKQYKDPEVRYILYHNAIQKQLQRGKYKEALNICHKYTMRQENSDVMKLYIITLFLNELWEELIEEFNILKITNEDIINLYKFALIMRKKYQLLEPVLNLTLEVDYIYFCLIKDQKIDNSLLKNKDLQIAGNRLSRRKT